jgi:phosphotransferase system HPr (HPr) family protein
MISKEVKIKNKSGLHARPAALFVKEANKFKSVIRVRKGEKEVNGKSMLSLLTLEACKGVNVEIKAEGEDENAALQALVDFLAVVEE